MGLIREPLDVDFFVDPRLVTKEEERMISEYISNQKLKTAKSSSFVKQVGLREILQ
jgi:hypothetical protein